MLDLRSNFAEWSKHEFACQHARMGNLQFWSVHRLISEEKNVDVEGAWALCECLFATQTSFDFAEGVEEFDGW